MKLELLLTSCSQWAEWTHHASTSIESYRFNLLCVTDIVHHTAELLRADINSIKHKTVLFHFNNAVVFAVKRYEKEDLLD
jgi:hypothetical protein